MVTLINKFTVASDRDNFERVWEASSEFMRTQPGFLRFRLVRALHDECVYFNIAEWETAEAHQKSLHSEAFRSHILELAKVATAEPFLCDMVLDYDAAVA
jgi:long-chain acyl-CoA synthetase